MTDSDLLLEIKDLKTYFYLHEGVVKAVDGASLDVPRHSTVGVVGESGCGKSVMARSVLRILDRGGKIVNGEIKLYRAMGAAGSSDITEVVDLVKLGRNSPEMRAIRGHEIAMIFQEPMSSFSPVHTVGFQIMEAMMLHQDLTKPEMRQQTMELLRRVGVARPERCIEAYPMELSGGMCQRAMIAMALSCQPRLLIADEPTTAIDVTTQAQLLDLLRELQQEFGMSVMMITHDLGVVAEMVDEVVVMYLGTVVEQAPVDAIFHDPQHPYTQCLLQSIPKLGPKTGQRLATIQGSIPSPYNRPAGCLFHPRCPAFMPDLCDKRQPTLTTLGDGRRVRCLLHERR